MLQPFGPAITFNFPSLKSGIDRLPAPRVYRQTPLQRSCVFIDGPVTGLGHNLQQLDHGRLSAHQHHLSLQALKTKDEEESLVIPLSSPSKRTCVLPAIDFEHSSDRAETTSPRLSVYKNKALLIGVQHYNSANDENIR